MKTIYSDAHRLHAPPLEFNYGDFGPAFETPQRPRSCCRGCGPKLGEIRRRRPARGGGASTMPADEFHRDDPRGMAEPPWRAAFHCLIAPACAASRRMLRGGLGYYCIDTDGADLRS
jgi:hypothetical protein